MLIVALPEHVADMNAQFSRNVLARAKPVLHEAVQFDVAVTLVQYLALQTLGNAFPFNLFGHGLSLQA
jgi:hypothetical protein